jgi:hypothetical protein
MDRWGRGRRPGLDPENGDAARGKAAGEKEHVVDSHDEYKWSPGRKADKVSSRYGDLGRTATRLICSVSPKAQSDFAQRRRDAEVDLVSM